MAQATQYVPVAPSFDGTPHALIPRPRRNGWKLATIGVAIALAISLTGGLLLWRSTVGDLNASKAYAAAQVTALGKAQDALRGAKAEVGNLHASVETLNGDLDTTQARLADAETAGRACHDVATYFARWINGQYPGTGVTHATIATCARYHWNSGPVSA